MKFSAEKKKCLDVFMSELMTRYSTRVPDVKKVTKAMVEKGIIQSEDDIQNDHVAFRTMGVENLGIKSLEKVFLNVGYEKRDYYNFEKKKLDAYWYSPPEDNYPRIFISQLRVGELSKKAQEVITSYTSEVKSDPVDSLDLDNGKKVGEFLHQSLWRTPTWEDYLTLREESEYASWVIYNRYYLNHYTISVHNLAGEYSELEKFNSFLEETGIKLNDSGGKVKISNDGILKQSSSVAGVISATFPSNSLDGQVGEVTHEIPGSYVEFAERLVKPEFAHLPKDEIRREHRRDGFEAANANKIFESTYTSQVDK